MHTEVHFIVFPLTPSPKLKLFTCERVINRVIDVLIWFLEAAVACTRFLVRGKQPKTLLCLKPSHFPLRGFGV